MYNEIIVLGIILSLIYRELTGFNPGGIIVPAYFAVSIAYPKRCLYTLLIAFASYLLVRFLSKYVILYGSRIFAVCIMISFAVNLALQMLGLPIPGLVSYLVPGILAREFIRQGIRVTAMSLTLVTGLLVLLASLVGVSLL